MREIEQGILAGLNDPYIKDICNETQQKFGNYYYFILSIAIDKIKQIIQYAKEHGLNIHEEYFLKQFYGDLYFEIASITFPTLIVEMNKRRKDNGNRKTEYILFSEELLKSNTIKLLYEKYPELYHISKNIVDCRLNYISEIIMNFVHDKNRLHDVFECNFEQLTSIKITEGDSHNGGKKVAIVRFNHRNLVYKPHHLEYDRLFYNILKKINHSKDVLIKNYIPRFLSLDTHSWQEYLVNYTCNTAEEVERYYYRLGVLLCICYMMNCSDIHYENLIANGEFPIIIDLETLVHLSADKNEYKGVLPSVMKEYCTSILGTLILPTNSVFSTFDFDISGIGGSQDSHSNKWKSFTLMNEGTSDIAFEEKLYVKNVADNCVKIQEEKVEAKKYFVFLRAGFTDAYRFVCNHKEEIRTELLQFDMTIRQVLRPTAIYARILSSSYYPDYLVSSEKRRKLFEKFYKNMPERENKRVASEIDRLVGNDIPYFCARVDQKAVYDGENNLVIEDYFNQTAMDIILAKLNKFSKENLSKQLYYMGLSGSTLKGDVSESAKMMVDEKLASDYLTFASYLGDLMLEKMIWEGDSCNYLTLSSLGNKRLVAYAGTELYENGGTVLFLLYLGKETNCDKYIKAARGLLKSFEEMKLCECLNGTSAFSGKMSVAYLYFEFYQLFHEQSDLEQCCDIIAHIDAKECHGYDMISGISSGIILMLNIYQVIKKESLMTKAIELGESLIRELDGKKEDMYTGLAHGFSGPAWSLIKLGQMVHEPSYSDLGIELMKYEDQFFDNNRMNWRDIRNDVPKENDSPYWCYGAAGIGISRIMAAEYSKEPMIIDDIKACVTRLSKEDDIDSHGLCHGIMGKIDTMNLFTNRGFLPKDSLEHEIKRVMSNIMEEGLRMGDKESFENYTFMLGLSGVGYALLRLHNPNIPCILALEV